METVRNIVTMSVEVQVVECMAAMYVGGSDMSKNVGWI